MKPLLYCLVLTWVYAQNDYDDFSRVLAPQVPQDTPHDDVDLLRREYEEQQARLQAQPPNNEQPPQQILSKYQEPQASVFKFEEQRQREYEQQQHQIQKLEEQFKGKDTVPPAPPSPNGSTPAPPPVTPTKPLKNIELQNQLLQEFENVDSDQSLHQLHTDSLTTTTLSAQGVSSPGLQIKDNEIILGGTTLVQFGAQIITADKLASLLEMNRKLVVLCGEELKNCQIKDNHKLDLAMLKETESMARFKELDSLISKQSEGRDSQYDQELSSIDKEIDQLF